MARQKLFRLLGNYQCIRATAIILVRSGATHCVLQVLLHSLVE
jgi:hypothetical protein